MNVPIQMGANCFGPDEMSFAFGKGPRPYMPCLIKIGGITGWLCKRMERMDLAGPILEPTLKLKDGKAHFGELPGAGIVWREQEIELFTL